MLKFCFKYLVSVVASFIYAVVANMADFSKSSNWKGGSKLETAIWASKLTLLCIGFITSLIMLKVAIFPYTLNLIVSTLAGFWISIRGWLPPPYVYIILNFIIILVVASSSFHHEATGTATTSEQYASPAKRPLLKTRDENGYDGDGDEVNEADSKNETDEVDDVLSEFSSFQESKKEGDDSEKMQKDQEKQNDKTGHEEEKDSLDETWKLIMEGKEKRRTRQSKKIETWDSPPKVIHKANEVDDPVAWARRELRKSDTFNDAMSLESKKSMSHEELNRRADEFINQMRLQRLESEQRFMQMVNRGVRS